MILEILKMPNEILSQKCESLPEITPEAQQLGKDMVETLVHNAELGLAAPQCGVLKRVIVALIDGIPVIMYNPIILVKSPKKESLNEGCLSYEKGVEYKAKRPAAVKIKYRNEQGKMIYKYLQGLNARIFSHEYMHLEGKTLSDEGELVE